MYYTDINLKCTSLISPTSHSTTIFSAILELLKRHSFFLSRKVLIASLILSFNLDEHFKTLKCPQRQLCSTLDSFVCCCFFVTRVSSCYNFKLHLHEQVIR